MLHKFSWTRVIDERFSQQLFLTKNVIKKFLKIVSVASYVYNLRGQKFINNATKWSFLEPNACVHRWSSSMNVFGTWINALIPRRFAPRKIITDLKILVNAIFGVIFKHCVHPQKIVLGGGGRQVCKWLEKSPKNEAVLPDDKCIQESPHPHHKGSKWFFCHHHHRHFLW